MRQEGGAGRWERLAGIVRRTRWWVAIPLALIYVFRPAPFGGETLGTVLLLTAGLYLWAPVLFEVGQNFRRGYREADE